MTVDSLNPMQKEAVTTTEGPLLLLAGAGSGKTKALVYRMAYLVENKVDPYNILAITFTNKAAKEMRERVEDLVQGGDKLWVSTFHSMCVRILRYEINKIGYESNFSIYDMSDMERLMKEIMREQNINDKLYSAKYLLSEIGKQKDELITPDDFLLLTSGDFKMQIIANAYKSYQKKLKASNALDFDDIIVKTVELFAMHPDVLGKYQSRFRYIMVDEYQDTNTAQYQLIRFLSAKYENICVVGDDDQSIYGWRGANIRNILDFEKDFVSAKTIKLEQNYRSTSTILDAANAVIKNNGGRKNKTLWTEQTGGSLITYFRAATDTEEAVFVGETVLRLQKEGKSFKDFAVLYRTNAQSRMFEDVFVRLNVPYRIFGGVRFYERKEIKDVISYLKAIVNPFDDIAVKRIINVPKRGIGNTSINKISDYANETGLSFFAACKDAKKILGTASRVARFDDFVQLMEDFQEQSASMPVSELIRDLLDKMGLLAELEKENTEESADRIQNIQELVTKAAEFEKQSANPVLTTFLEEIALVADIDNYSEGDNAIVLMTLHSAKGLEFPEVFIVGAEEGVFPGYRALTSDKNNEMEEERRLCYVGITRAKEKLYITNALERRQNGYMTSNKPSRFLKEIPVSLIEDGMARPKKRPRIQSGARHIKEENTYMSQPLSERRKSNVPIEVPVISKETLTFDVGDKVMQMKYGEGRVLQIIAAGADYEVTIEFPTVGKKKFMAHLSKLQKVE